MSFYSDEDMKNHTDDFVRAMVKHKAYEGVIDGEDMFEDLLEEGLTEEFIQYYSERRGISKQQRYCDHDNMDTFSADGMFYNYVGDCNKCLLESKNNPQEDDENMVEMFEVWQDARKKADKELLDHLGYAANQLEGVSVAIEAHGTNINPAFFIKEYKEMADEKREIIKKYKEED